MKTKDKVGITVNPTVWEKFDAVAKRRGMSKSTLLEQYMREEIAKEEKVADELRAAANARRR